MGSDGMAIANPKFLSKQLPRLKIEQRKFARMKKGSGNRARQKKVVAKIHEDVTRARHHFIHQATYHLAVKNHATTVMMESLRIKNMVRNHKLARHIADCSWGMFGNLLQYKLAENGKNLIKIDTFLPSTKQCRTCKTKNSQITLEDRTFVCHHCAHTEDRDLHAAINIRDFGLEEHTRSLGSCETVKCSPDSISDGADESAKGSNVIGMGRLKEAPAKVALAA
jgi:putative transposase